MDNALRFVMLMLRGSLVLLGLAACTSMPLPATSSASSAGPLPGHWELMIVIEGLPGTLKPQTMTLCSTPADKKQWQDMVSGRSTAGCTVRDFKASGKLITYGMQCAEGIEGSAQITIIDDNHYSGESALTLRTGDQPTTIRSRIAATRLSPTCPQ